MVLNALDITTAQPVPCISKDEILLTKNLKSSVAFQTVALSANSISTVSIDCRQFKTITLYGVSTANNLVNISYSDDNITFFNTNKKLNIFTINSVDTFELTIDHIPNYIKFFNDNGSSITLTLEYVLYN
tara:strand:+ start:560 stop:949 length:390 start_codon:yes stop_codon:yes gene_type:complete